MTYCMVSECSLKILGSSEEAYLSNLNRKQIKCFLGAHYKLNGIPRNHSSNMYNQPSKFDLPYVKFLNTCSCAPNPIFSL